MVEAIRDQWLVVLAVIVVLALAAWLVSCRLHSR